MVDSETHKSLKEIVGKTVTNAAITTDRNPETRGIGCSSRQSMLVTFADGTALEVVITGNFGLKVVEDVDVTLRAVLAYPEKGN